VNVLCDGAGGAELVDDVGGGAGESGGGAGLLALGDVLGLVVGFVVFTGGFGC
jgi:hypothetical protein